MLVCEQDVRDRAPALQLGIEDAVREGPRQIGERDAAAERVRDRDHVAEGAPRVVEVGQGDVVVPLPVEHRRSRRQRKHVAEADVLEHAVGERGGREYRRPATLAEERQRRQGHRLQVRDEVVEAEGLAEGVSPSGVDAGFAERCFAEWGFAERRRLSGARRCEQHRCGHVVEVHLRNPRLD